MTIIDIFKLAVGGLIGMSAAILVCYVFIVPGAKEDARRDERATQLQNTMKAIEKRSDTNEKIENLPDPELCRALGGVYENGICQ